MSPSIEGTSDVTDDETWEVAELPDETGEGPGLEGTDPLHGAEDPRQFRLEHSEEYLEPMGRARAVGQFRDPHETVERINPYFDAEVLDEDPHNVNCADCARCFEATWRGQEQEAAGRAYQIGPSGGLEVSGEASSRTEEWAREEFTRTRVANLRAVLERGGHGASAIVHSTWGGELPGGHAYNIVNFEGRILTVDPQQGEVLDFSDREVHPSLESLPDSSHRAMAWDANGRRIL